MANSNRIDLGQGKRPFKFNPDSSKSGKRRHRVNETLTLSDEQHNFLLSFLCSRLDSFKSVRSQLCARLASVDEAVFAKDPPQTKSDCKVEKDNAGQDAPNKDITLPLIEAKLDEATTIVMSMLFPDNGMYSAIATKDEQDTANAFATLMGKHAADFNHYTGYSRAIHDMLKYNLGGFLVEWKSRYGDHISINQQTFGAIGKYDVTSAGNKITAIDPYNSFWDHSVEVDQVCSMGEYFAMAEMRNRFEIDRAFRLETKFNKPATFTNFTENKSSNPNTIKFKSDYYVTPPAPRDFVIETDGQTDWDAWIGKASSDNTHSDFSMCELVTIYIHLVPEQFGLSKSKDYEIWKFEILESDTIILAERQENSHGYLPAVMAMPNQSAQGINGKSIAETLKPLQDYASTQFNIHVRSQRKKLNGGLIIYDKRVIPLDEVANPTNGYLAANLSSHDTDIRRHILQMSDVPQTERTLEDSRAIGDLMESIFPTAQVQQVASLERATKYQAAATVQASNRRQYKLARLIEDQAMHNSRRIQMYNIMQFQQTISILAETGERVEIAAETFQEADLEFKISDGLRGIDRMYMADMLKDVINMSLQSRMQEEGVDIMGMIDQLMTMSGEPLDMTQFVDPDNLVTLARQLPEEIRPQAQQMLMQMVQQLQQQSQEQQGAGQPQGQPQ